MTWQLSLAGLLVGVLVGMTGMGGASCGGLLDSPGRPTFTYTHSAVSWCCKETAVCRDYS